MPVATSFEATPPIAWRHRFDLAEVRGRYRALPALAALRERVVSDADRVLAGEMRLYGGHQRQVGAPPRWHVNPFTGHEYPRVHWADISDDDASRGDIKDVWELSRLPFTCILVRAYVLTGDGRYPERWWELVEDWAAHNRPNLGVNWRCGQETSLRAIALCFGLSSFSGHPSSTPARVDLAHRILGASADRVRPTVGYALSQRNNHAVSELVFLLSVRAEDDERRLLRYLLEVLDDQFYEDGSYAQQSFTYQRLAVQALQWLLLTRPDLPRGARNRVAEVLARSRDFLARCSDPVGGWLPNYGANDGALLFHLSGAHYRDFRPLLASLGAPGLSEYGEEAIWTAIDEVSDRVTSADRAPSTYVTLRGSRSLALMRVGAGRHRAAHADQLALDLWVDGQNLVLDPGTYRYTAPPPWRNALAGRDVHSLAMEEGVAQVSIGRFLSEGMPAGELLHHGAQDGAEIVVARRPAGRGHLYRAIIRRGDAYSIVDGAEGVTARVRWNLADSDRAVVQFEPDGEFVPDGPREDDPASGWNSPLYAHREAVTVRHVPLSEGSYTALRIAPSRETALDPSEAWRLLEGTGMPLRTAAPAPGGSETQ